MTTANMLNRILFTILLIFITACGGDDGGGSNVNVSGYWEMYDTSIYDPSGTEYGPNFLDLTQSDGSITGIFIFGDSDGGAISGFSIPIDGKIDGTSIRLYFEPGSFVGDLRLNGQVINNNNMTGDLEEAEYFVDWEIVGTWRAERIYSIPY